MGDNKQRIECPDKDIFIADVLSGMRVYDLCEKYNVCHSLISRWRVEFGLGKQYDKFKNLNKNKFIKDCKTLLPKELMEKHDVSDATIREWKRKLGIKVSKPLSKTHDEFLKEVYDKHGNEFETLDTYTNSYTKIRFKHVKCGLVFSASPSSFLTYIGCPKCSFEKYTKRTIKKHSKKFDEYFQKNMAENYKLLSEYKGSNKHIKINHLKCGHTYKTTPCSVLKGHGCPKCGHERTGASVRKTHEEFHEEFKKIYGDDYELIDEYKGINKSVTILHKECGETYKKLPATLLSSGSLCPYCKTKAISNGEKRIERYLKTNCIEYEMQYSFPDCFNEQVLKFDFAIFDNNHNLLSLIEFDGKQHFEPIKYYGGIDTYKRVVKRDKIKNDYCKQNDIKLIRIPYYNFSKIEEILDDIFK